ncbi:MAG TPA: magnesium/cobalt transporter CorA [Actinomycetota bacterium]|nr:magnesium/cobalt transporter CorA [Actinomycetota bacterium]
MLTVRLYRGGNIEEEGFDPARISDLLQERGTLVWLDLEDPTDEELGIIQEEFSLHALAIEDAQHRDQRPKLETYPGHHFLVFYGIELTGEQFRTHEVHAFVGRDHLITLRYDPSFDLDPVLKRWERQIEMTRQGGGYLIYALLDEVVDGYFEVVEGLEDASEAIERALFGDVESASLQQRIFHLKKQLLEVRRLVAPLREVLATLQQDEAIVTEPLRAYYRDVADHVIRVATFLDNIRELTTTALEAHLSQVSNRLNVVMKQVTSWAAIILVPTLIAGYYGMNFRFLPWPLGSPGGPWIAVALMLVSAAALYVVFKRQEWL